MRYGYLLAVFLGFAILNTAFLGVYIVSGRSSSQAENGVTMYVASTTTAATLTQAQSTTSVASATQGPLNSSLAGLSSGSAAASFSADSAAQGGIGPGSAPQAVFQFLEVHSLALAPASWFLVGGMWIWRGRMKSRWLGLGFDSDVFGLFVKMKGAKTRIRLLDALSSPKDRLQLAQELGLDWKGVDRHITILRKYGFVEDRVAYGKVRIYALTPMGQSLLHLLNELSREEPTSPAGLPEIERQA